MKKIISVIICVCMIIAAAVTALAVTDPGEEDIIITVGAENPRGDVNEDGEANNKDVVTLFRYVSGGEKAEDEAIYDFDGDGEVNNKDVVALFRYLSSTTEEPEQSEEESEEESVDESEDESEEESEEESIDEPEDESEEESEEESIDESEDESEEESEEIPEEYETFIYEDPMLGELIYVRIPDGYTAYDDYQGFPSIVSDSAPDGRCFFNFMTQDVSAVMTDATADVFLEAMRGTIGNYTKDNFESYDVDGIPVTKLDYTWGNKIAGHGVKQSLVKVYFEYCTVVIQFAVWDDVPEGMDDFALAISGLGICEEALDY